MTKHYYFDHSDNSIAALNAPLESQEGEHFTTAEELVATGVSDQQLLDWYNLDNDAPVESFESREAAAEAIFAMLKAAEPAPQGQVVQAQGQVAPTKAEQAAANKAAREEEKAAAKAEKEKAKAEAAEAKAKAKAEKEAARAEKKASKPARTPKDGTSAGRTSKLAGSTLKHTVPATVPAEGDEPVIINPRRDGTHGHKSLSIIIASGSEGIKYEDFITAGGRAKDLAWDVSHGWATVEEAKA